MAKLKSLSFVLIFNIFLLGTPCAQEKLHTDLALPYLVQLPTISSTNPPVIILMHGFGSNEADLFELKDVLPKNFLVVAVQAPLALGNNSFQWYNNETINGNAQGNRKDIANSVAKVKALVPEIIKRYHVDATQIYLAGFSQGAMMSYEVGLTAPQMFRGIAPLSGRIYEALKPNIKMSEALKQLKIFIGHGDADNRVNYSFAQASYQYLKGLGLNPEFHTYKGLQHSINQEELNDLVKWLTKR